MWRTLSNNNIGLELISSKESLRNSVNTDEDNGLLAAGEVVLTDMADVVPEALAKPEPDSLHPVLERSVKDGLQLSTSLLELPSQQVDTDGEVEGQWNATRSIAAFTAASSLRMPTAPS